MGWEFSRSGIYWHRLDRIIRVAEIERAAGLRFFDRTDPHCHRAADRSDRDRPRRSHARRGRGHAPIDCRTAKRSGRPYPCVGPVILGQQMLAPIIAGFLDGHPGCELTLDLSNRRVDLVDERFDVAFLVGPSSERDLIARSLGNVDAGLFRVRRQDGPDTRTVKTPADLGACAVGLLRSDNVKRPILPLTKDGGEDHPCTVHARLVTRNPWLLTDVAASSDLMIVLPLMVGAPPVTGQKLEPV